MKKHSIEEYVRLIEANNLLIHKDSPPEIARKTVRRLAYNSTKVGSDTLFICKGAGFKEEYLDAAIHNGAIMYVSEVNYHKNIPCLIVNDIQKPCPGFKFILNYPWNNLTLIGITGTKENPPLPIMLNIYWTNTLNTTARLPPE